MVGRFCPKCGISIKEGTFCSECSKKPIKIEVPLIQVSEFSRTFHKGLWHPYQDLEDLIIKRIRESAGQDYEIDIEPFEFDIKPKEKITVDAHVKIRDDEELTIPVKLSYRQCDFGQKQKTQYFEGILQLQNITDKVIEFLDKQMELMAPKGVFITKTVETKKGVDLYFTKKNPMRIIAQKIVAKFGGKIDENAQLFSHNHLTSKDLFRLNIHLELPIFGIDDVIEFDLKRIRGEDLRHVAKIQRMGKLIQGIELFNGKPIAFELKLAKEIKKITIFKTSISTIHPSIEVLHPETYQSEIPRNIQTFKKNVKPGDEVSVVKVKEGILII